MAIHARESTLAQVALREQRESEFGNPNCEAPSNILWGGPVLCSPISETFPVSILVVCSSGVMMLRAGMCWETASQLCKWSWQHPPCSRVMRAEALSWDNKIFMCLGNMYFPCTWALWVRACSQ